MSKIQPNAPLYVTLNLVALSFVNFAFANADSQAFAGSKLSESLRSEEFKLALCFCTGVSAPQLVSLALGRPTNLATALACAVINISVLLPHLVMFVWTTQEINFSSLYTTFFCFQYCVFAAVSSGIFMHHLPATRAFRLNIITYSTLFIVGITLYVATLNYPRRLLYGTVVYVVCALLSLSFVAYALFLRRSLLHIFSPPEPPATTGHLVSESAVICLMCHAGIIFFILLDFGAFTRIGSVRMTDFDVFSVCWHAYVKAGLTFLMAHLLPAQLSEVSAGRLKSALHDFVGALTI